MAMLLRSIVLFAVSMPASAFDPQQFATVWPIAADGAAPALRLQLPTEVYAELTDPGLRDLMVFNAAGEPVPFGPIARRPTTPARFSAPATWFEVPSIDPENASTGLRLLVERDADGRLRRLDAELPDAATPAFVQSWLLDLSDRDAPVDRLTLAWPAAGARTLQVSVATSNDLARWTTVVERAPLLDLSRDGLRLLKNEITLPASGADYLLLTRTDEGAPLVLDAIEVGHSSAVEAGDAVTWRVLDPQPDPERRDAWRYTLPGPLPVAQLDVVLASDNSVARIEFASRDAPDQPWRVRAGRTVFQVQDGGQTITSGPAAIGPLRDREWRLVAEPALDRPPQLRVGYRPDSFLMLARGEPPFVLAAGSATARRPDYPVDSLLDALRERRGADWQPVDASLGTRGIAAGEPARQAPLPWQRWLLWGLLIGAALLLATMVLRLVRSG